MKRRLFNRLNGLTPSRYNPAGMFWNRITNRGGSFDIPPGDLKGRPLGRVLTKMGKVTREQVVETLNLQKSEGGLLGEILVKLGYIEPADILKALAAQRGEQP